MQHWIVILIGIALIAALLGFRRLAALSFGIGEVLIFVLVILIALGVVVVLASGVV